MKLSDIFRIIRSHLVLLILIPLLLSLMVTFLTRKPKFVYTSETTLFTGIASGGTVDMDKGFNFFATNTAFDNLINVIKARETQVEVGIHLLAQHLMLKEAEPKFISKKALADLHRITPDYVKRLISNIPEETEADKEEEKSTLPNTGIASVDSIIQPAFSFKSLDTSGTSGFLPSYVNPKAYEQTVRKLKMLMISSDTNFVYKLLNFSNPHYSIGAISRVSVQRITSSDLVNLKYENDDPGICQQTLIFLTKMCIQNYKLIKENRSDAVVKYFEYQVKQAAERLKIGEDKLLKFNEDNNIINYYEQSKAIAIVKEDLDVTYHNKRIKLAGAEAAIKRIEEKLGVQKKVQLQSDDIIQNRNKLAYLSSKIEDMETIGYKDSIDNKEYTSLKTQLENVKEDMRKSVSMLSTYSTTTEGLPIATLLGDWLTNVLDYEVTKAGIAVLGERIKEFQKQYAIYAPAGANLKRIERQINVSEQEFLELLHGLNLAKLKMQDIELSSNIKAVDAPYFPLSANPTKRKILIILAALVGFLLVLTTIIALEYFDNTLKSLEKAKKVIGLKPIGIFPKVLLKTKAVNFLFVANRLIEIIIQQLELIIKAHNSSQQPKTVVFFSSVSNEGKSVLISNIAFKLKKQGKKVVVLSFSRDSLRKNEMSQIGYQSDPIAESVSGAYKRRTRLPILSMLLGYPDTRINYDSPFLKTPEETLEQGAFFSYKVDESFFSFQNVSDLMEHNNIQPVYEPDYYLVEFPPVLYYNYPGEFLNQADLAVLVCRANRTWTDADNNAMDGIRQVYNREPVFILNGSSLPAVSTLLGELPANSSWLKQKMKKILLFQIYSRHQI